MTNTRRWTRFFGWLAVVGWLSIASGDSASAAEKKKTKTGAQPPATSAKGTAAKPATSSDAVQPEAAPPADRAPATTEATPPSSGSSPARSATDDPANALQLRGLEERVNDLKERIFRSKARLILLRETVLNSVISGAKAQIVHRNEMGSSFVLESASYSLDGAPIFNKTEGTELDQKDEIELFNGSIVPGNHNLSVFLVYRGNGYGVFSYLKGYKFKIKSSYTFTAEEGRITSIKAVAYEKGGFTTDLKDRPAIRYDVEVKQDANATPAAATQDATEKPAKPARSAK